MVTRRTRDPKVAPTRVELERELARAMVAVWDESTVRAMIDAVVSQSYLAMTYRAWYDDKGMPDMADKLKGVVGLLEEINRARVLQSVQTPGSSEAT